MQNFLQQVTKELLNNNQNLQHTTLITASKRAAVFFKQILKNHLKPNSFLPKIQSIEEFIESVSGINQIDNTELLFRFYKIYLQETKKENQETFDKFIPWANIILNDFNELDRYLINVKEILDYLSDIKRIENWFLENQETKLTKNYLNYFKNIKKYYTVLNENLLQSNNGYQGLIYRKAKENIDSYLYKNKNENYIFIGLNALNKAEEQVIKKILTEKKGAIYFDLDYYINENLKSYGKFINTYKNDWHYFNTNDFKIETNDFIKAKNIEIIGVPKNVTQIKEANLILKKLSKTNENLEHTALILANENLLPISLNSLPKEVEKVNITMGYPLKNSTTANLFKAILHLYKNQIKLNLTNQFYHKDVINVLNNYSLQPIFKENKTDINQVIHQTILKENLIFIPLNKLQNLTQNKNVDAILKLLFTGKTELPDFLKRIVKLITEIKKNTKHHLETEYLNRFYNLFQQIINFNLKFNYIKDLNTLEAVFNQLITTENLSFKGEPLQGLQIMGMLETRNLDFKNLIITSVNEGFLPSGKTNNTFIPFDVKKEIGLPTYTEKDAIFSYHFFRLLQRAKNIYLLYNTETDDFGASEKSRFLLQLEHLSKHLPQHKITQKIVSPISKLEQQQKITIPKSEDIIKKMDAYNENKGFSPSALTTYIANPIYFYQQRILGIKDLSEIEETIALNTLGTVVHDVLEDLYKPLLNKVLIKEDILKIQKKVTEKTLYYFEKHFKNGNYQQGKNLLIFEIAKQYITNFLNLELKNIQQKNEIIVIALEEELKANIKIYNNTKTIYLKGIADRIELYNGTLRIIDYKTGKADQSMLNNKVWEFNRENHKSYAKRFQVMFYAYCYIQNKKINLDKKAVESGIISFKNLKNGFLKVNNKPISKEDLITFTEELTWLLEEIYNINQPFIENKNAPF